MIVVNINGTDRKKFIDWKSLKIQNILTSQVDKCSFILNQNYTDNEFIPEAGMEVIITDDGTRVFAGYIVRRDKNASNYKFIKYKIECVDYTRLLQKKLVAETYESMTVEDIIKAIIDRYASGMSIDYSNVVCTKNIEKISFNYESVQQCIQKLSDIVGYDWWVDYNKNLYFKGVGTVSAPFALTDTNGNYVFNSLRIRKDNSQIKNTIIVRGGNYFGDNRRNSIEANGVDFAFPLPYKYKNFTASLTGQALNLGIDFSSDPDSHDALYNYNEKRLIFKEADTPSIGATLSVSGEPLIPVIVKVKDPTSIEAMLSAEGVPGEYEHIIVDKKLSSKQEARDRANAELIAYKSSLVEGEFETETGGLEAGQQISITSDAYDIDETYLVKQVTRVMMTPTVMRYRVRLISTRTIDMIGLLQKLLLGQTADIDFSSDEIVDLVTSFYEEITLDEATPAVSKVHNPQLETLTAEEDTVVQDIDYPIKFVAGPYIPDPVEDNLQQAIDPAGHSSYSIYGVRKWGQRFTPSENYKIGKFGIYTGRTGSPGTVNAYIYLADGSGFPTGDVLASGSFDGNAIGIAKAWNYGYFDEPYELQSGTEYSFYFEAPSGNTSNDLDTGYQNSSQVAGENMIYNSGSSWTNYANFEILYRIYENDTKRVFNCDGSRLG
jgi:hypothetical protein